MLKKTPYFLFALSITCLFSCKSGKITSESYVGEWTFTKGIEGPATDKNHNLYAVNFANEGTIGIVDKKGVAKEFIKLPEGSIGNGIQFNTQGDMFIADYTGHNVLQVDMNSKEIEVWAHNPNMSQPNDLAIAPNGTIYLTDPNWAESTGRLWMVNSKREIVLLEDQMGTTNGIAITADGNTMYINESAQRKIWKYTILSDGSLSNKTKFMEFKDFGLDGMRCDEKGNVYITRYDKGTVLIVSSKAEKLTEVSLKGKKPSNITFGGLHGKTCYVTMADRGCFEVFTAPFNGVFLK